MREERENRGGEGATDEESTRDEREIYMQKERRGEERASSLWTGRLIPNMEQIKGMIQNTRL